MTKDTKENHHHHSHGHNHTLEHIKSGNLLPAFLLNSFFVIVEITGGLLTNSSAILSDAVHDLGDSLSLGLALILQKASKKKQDKVFTYGYGGLSLVASLISATVILLGSVWIILESVPKFWQPAEINSYGMLIIAAFGLIFNALAMIKAGEGKTLLNKVISLHFLEDTLGWLAVLIGSVFIILFKAVWLDPLLAILIALYSAFNAFKLILATLKIMIQSVPDNVDLNKIRSSLTSITGVKAIHDLHIWSIDSQKHVLSVHLVTSANSSTDSLIQIKQEAKHRLEHLHIFHSTVEVELEGEKCHQADNLTI